MQVNEKNEKMSFKMGVKFAASVSIGKYFLDVHECVCTEGREL